MSPIHALQATIAQGVAFGTGSVVAHKAVDAIMGPRTIQHETVGTEVDNMILDLCCKCKTIH